jgi:hypothetical protein
MKLYMFQTVPLSIVRRFSLYTLQWYMSYWFVDSLQAAMMLWDTVGLWVSPQCIPLLCVQWNAPDDGQMNCPKHSNFISFQNKFEKLVHPFGSLYEIYHFALSHECWIQYFQVRNIGNKIKNSKKHKQNLCIYFTNTMWEVYIKHRYSLTLIGLRYNYFKTLREREREEKTYQPKAYQYSSSLHELAMLYAWKQSPSLFDS